MWTGLTLLIFLVMSQVRLSQKDAEGDSSEMSLDASLWHSILRYFRSSILVADDVG